MNKKFLGLGATLISGIYFGFMPLMLKTVYANGGNSFTGSFLRFAFAVPELFVILKIKGISLKITGEELKDLILITIFGYGGTSILLFSSYIFIPSGMSTTIHFLYPTVTVLGLMIFYKEKIKIQKIICVGLCLFGVIMFYEPEGKANLIGLVLALLSSITYGFYTIYIGRSSLKKMESLKSLFYMTSFAAAMLGIIGGISGNITFELKATGWIVMIMVSCLTTFIGALGYQIGVKYIGSVNTAMLSTVEPITSVIVGIMVYNEVFTFKTALGCVAILAATVMIARMDE